MVVLNKKRITLVAIAACFSIFAFMFTTAKLDTKETVVLPVSGKTIVLDAGHGIPDEGAQSSNGTTEAQTNLKIMLKFCEQFGLTPSARSRIATESSPQEADPMELILLHGGKSHV